VFATSDDGERVGEIAELLRVSVAYVSKALTRRRTTGETTVRARHGHKLPKLAPFYAATRAYVAERVGLIWHTLKLLGLSLKKSRSGPPNRIDRTSPRPGRNGARTSRSWKRAG
jgi:transposase